MKTSKIILFSYISLLALIFLGFVIYLTQFDHETRHREQMDFKTISEELPSFKYISVDEQSVTVRSGEITEITVMVRKDTNDVKINYHLAHDTLFIKKSDAYINLTVNITNPHVVNLISNKSHVWINDMKSDTLNYEGSGNSELSGFRNTEIHVVNAMLSESRFYAYNGSFDQINLDADRSNVNVRCMMSEITGQIKDNSEVRFNNAEILNMKKDKSSRFYCYP
ncbi:hypothetical protein ACE01N_15815 [Saccharicrinis sp. FJH2]|uniref:hypothetical protein n=1 Tax=Saccharicrinis sp. FJH65 TaxID=3344659 RepID=UPI0035F3F15F